MSLNASFAYEVNISEEQLRGAPKYGIAGVASARHQDASDARFVVASVAWTWHVTLAMSGT
jgi:hypothetical protein